MTEMLPDDLSGMPDLADLADLGGSGLIDTPIDPGNGGPMDPGTGLDTEVVVESFWYEEWQTTDATAAQTAPALPSPFDPETVVGAVTAAGGLLARRFASRGGERVVVELPGARAADAAALEQALVRDPAVRGASAVATGPAGSAAIAVEVERKRDGAVLQRLAATVGAAGHHDAVFVLADGTRRAPKELATG